MNETIRRDLISIYAETEEAITSKNFDKLSEISNHTIHNASIFQDEDSISAAVIVYSLSKIFIRNTKVDSAIMRRIGGARKNLEANRLGAYNREVKELSKAIRKLDNKMSVYIQQVINEAEIRKGSKLYDQGISLARASQLLNLSQWELMSYVGKTKIIDRNKDSDKGVTKRIKLARRIFSI